MALNIISRREWGARPPKNPPYIVSWREKTEFIVHHSAGSTNQSVRDIQASHLAKWSDIGYNFLVDVKGRIYEGRGWLAVGAQAKGHNRIGIGVCFIGNSETTGVPLIAKKSIRTLYEEACRRKGTTLRKTGHGLLPDQATLCPGLSLRAWVKAGMPIDEDDVDEKTIDTIAKRVLTIDGVIPAPPWVQRDQKNKYWPLSTYTDWSYRNQAETENKVNELTKKVDEILRILKE